MKKTLSLKQVTFTFDEEKIIASSVICFYLRVVTYLTGNGNHLVSLILEHVCCRYHLGAVILLDTHSIHRHISTMLCQRAYATFDWFANSVHCELIISPIVSNGDPHGL